MFLTYNLFSLLLYLSYEEFRSSELVIFLSANDKCQAVCSKTLRKHKGDLKNE